MELESHIEVRDLSGGVLTNIASFCSVVLPRFLSKSLKSIIDVDTVSITNRDLHNRGPLTLLSGSVASTQG